MLSMNTQSSVSLFLSLSSAPSKDTLERGEFLESQCRKNSRKTLHNPLCLDSSCPGGNLCGWRGLFPNPPGPVDPHQGWHWFPPRSWGDQQPNPSSQLPSAWLPTALELSALLWQGAELPLLAARALPSSFVSLWHAWLACQGCLYPFLSADRQLEPHHHQGGFWRMDVASNACDSVCRDTGISTSLLSPSVTT